MKNKRLSKYITYGCRKSKILWDLDDRLIMRNKYNFFNDILEFRKYIRIKYDKQIKIIEMYKYKFRSFNLNVVSHKDFKGI